MTQPAQYTPQTDFSQDEANAIAGRSTVRTDRLDTEFANIVVSLNKAITNLGLIQRDDGALLDGVVTLQSFSATLQALLVTLGARPRGAWLTATAYAVRDVVETGSPLTPYMCVTAHTSGVFATDRTAGKWVLIGSVTTTASNVAFTPTGGVVATNVQSAITEVDSEKLTASLVSAFGLTLIDDADGNAALTTLTALRSESGAVATPTLTYLRRVILPENFGATGDGVTNDGPAIQLAINAAAALTGGEGGCEVLLGSKLYITNQKLVLKSKVVLKGTNSRSTVLRAGASFPATTPVVEVDTTAGSIFGARAESMTIDCNSVSGSVGFRSVYGQEQCGARHVVVLLCDGMGMDFGASTGSMVLVKDCEIFPTASCLTGIQLDNFSAILRLENVSVSRGGAVPPAGSDAVRVVQGTLVATSLHVEMFEDGIDFRAESGGSVMGMTGHSTVTNLVHITASNRGVVLGGLFGNSATNLVKDDIGSGKTITGLTGGGCPFYVLGDRNDTVGASNRTRVMAQSDSTTATWDMWQNINMHAGLTSDVPTLTNNSATPDISQSEVFLCGNSGATTITNFTGATKGRRLIIYATNGNTIVQHNANIYLDGAVDFYLPTDGALMLLYEGTKWREVTRQSGAAENGFTDLDTTPSVKFGKLQFANYSAPTTITNFDDGVNGQEIKILFGTSASAITIQANANIKPAGGVNFVSTTNDTIKFLNRSGIWYETGRSVN